MNIEQQLNIFRDYLNLSAAGPSLQEMVINAVVLAIMVSILSWVYVKTARTLSNRKRLAAIFPLLSLTTMMIISVIQSSLALSLGLVGALSIVRFRSAIKEPEELTYIFLAISLGLGMGAGQQELTIGFFVLVTGYLLAKNALQGRFKLFDFKSDDSLYLSFTTSKSNLSLDQIVSELDQVCHYIELKRWEKLGGGNQEFLFVVKVKDYNLLAELRQGLASLDQQAGISVLNDEKLFS